MKRKITGAVALAASAALWAHAALVVNEACYDNSELADETGNTGLDWIELYNSGPSGVNVLGYGLWENNTYAESVKLPNYTIPVGGFLVVFADSDLVSPYTVWTNAPDLAVVPANATWKYSAPSSAPAATWKTNTFNDASWGSGIAPFGYNDPKLNMDCATVLGYGGNPASRYPAAYFRKTFTLANPSAVTGIVVNARLNDGAVVYLNGVEVLRQNMPDGAVAYSTLASMGVPSTLWTSTLLPTNGLVAGTNLLAVELHQAAVSSVDLIMDLTVTALVSAQVPFVHCNFGLGKSGADNVHLFNSAGTRIHRFDESGYELGENKSYGLAVDGATGTYKKYSRPTPGLLNSTYPQKYQETLASQKPTFSVPPGFYLANQSVVLNTAQAGYRVYFTLDGSDPRDSSVYVFSGYPVTLNAAAPATNGLAWLRTNPVEIGAAVPAAAWLPPVGSVPKAVVLRAIAVDATLQQFCSPETRGTYFIGAAFTNRTLPVVSLITDTNNLFGFASGLYVPGKYYADSPEGYGLNKWGKPYANYHQDSNGVSWERPVYFELFETAQTAAAVAQVLGVTMHGGGTRAIPQKTLYLLARAAEYGSDNVSYPLFPDEAPTAYKRFLLRNSGNDWYGPDYGGVATLMKDAVFHRIVKNLDISVMAYRPTVAYVNGEYWGIHNLRESFDKHYLATRYGLEADNMDLLMHEEDAIDNDKVKITRIDGDTACDEEYESLIDWIQDNPLAQDANMQRVQSAVVFTNGLNVPITGIDVTNHADYIIAETFFANTDWPINNCDFWRAHTNQVASAGKYGDTRWRWMLYDLDVAGEQPEGAAFDMFDYLQSSKMTGGSEPGFLINQLWSNMGFRNYFANRYANLLNTTFRPERMSALISQAAEAIRPEVETHFRRWGRTTTMPQWGAAVSNVLANYTATRHAVSWAHLDAALVLGGTGTLTVANSDAGGTGGRFTVNGVIIDASTEGVTNRAAWSGTFFRSLPVPVQAVPDAGYVFDGWVGTAVTNPSPSLFVGPAPITLTARFRPAAAPAYSPSGYERWQLANYSEQEILGSGAALPDAASGCAGLSNVQLYAFGMSRSDGLSDEQRQARMALSIHSQSNALWVGYTRLNGSFNDVNYTLKTAAGLAAPVAWSNAVTGLDLDPVTLTNVLDASTWFYEVRLPAASPARDARFFKLEAALQ
ncbi:MAG TPA: CotH kinase family protein [Kiritimatiellia bacterium]|nr:CotH kinase family protein [Kiritimatiellia bacterium]HPS07750.1 CotH kinase family protein [Kiritimatiellia bacterium]